MWFYSARKVAAIVALSSAMIGVPNTTSTASSLDPVPTLVLDMRNASPGESTSSSITIPAGTYVQNVPVGALGQSQTWYVPAEGAPTISGDAYFRASHSVAGAPPLNTEISGSGQSNFLYVRSE